jgi:hypothetical protein
MFIRSVVARKHYYPRICTDRVTDATPRRRACQKHVRVYDIIYFSSPAPRRDAVVFAPTDRSTRFLRSAENNAPEGRVCCASENRKRWKSNEREKKKKKTRERWKNKTTKLAIAVSSIRFATRAKAKTIRFNYLHPTQLRGPVVTRILESLRTCEHDISPVRVNRGFVYKGVYQLSQKYIFLYLQYDTRLDFVKTVCHYYKNIIGNYNNITITNVKFFWQITSHVTYW